MSLSDQIKAKTEEIRKLPKIDFKELKYKKLLQRIEAIEQDRKALTQEFQNQFSIIEKLLGCLTDAIEQLRVQIQSIQNSK